jgi:isopenicillin N synthase-like dioxygenase
MTTAAAPTMTPELVILDWKDIAFNDSHHGAGGESTSSPSSSSFTSPLIVMEALERALGENGMGLVAIRNVPGFVAAKQAFLPQAHKLVKLPREYLEGDELTDQASLYNAGWSHGKEKLGNGVPDLAKGSYYFNPITDLPGSPQDRATYPLSYPPNKWPSNEMLPDFKNQAVTLGCLLKNVVVTLCRHVDALAAQKVGAAAGYYPADFLYNVMKDTEKVKARLLYYFPLETTTTTTTATAGTETTKKSSSSAASAEDSWTGWHLDSGFLTALAGDFYVNHETGEILEQSPDPNSGLYIVDRHDQVRHVQVPADCLAVQIGECTQICTGGAVVATPHCVRGCVPTTAPAAADSTTPTTTVATTTPPAFSRVARISMPCFIDTPPTFPLSVPHGSSREQVLQAGLQSRRVPPLEMRWTRNGMTFGDFLNDTFAIYYDWKQPPATN